MTETELSRAEWHKSSYSSQDGNCVDVARNLPGLVAVRDSKEPDGAKLVVSQEAWRVFIKGLLASLVVSLREDAVREALVNARRVLGHLGLDLILQVNPCHLG
jgi:hypothetical protein